jgi:hypothetical protein
VNNIGVCRSFSERWVAWATLSLALPPPPRPEVALRAR